jgi:hypothetical protein
VFSYLMKMTRAHTLIVLVGLTAMFAVPARAQSDIMSDNYNIMVPEKGYKPSQPEPWLAPKYKSPRGTVKRVTIPKTTTVSPAEHRCPGRDAVASKRFRIVPCAALIRPAFSAKRPATAAATWARALINN